MLAILAGFYGLRLNKDGAVSSRWQRLLSMDAFPEGNTAAPFDDEQRSLVKWASLLYDSGGNVPTAYPEGSQPLPFDDEERLLVKINAMRE